MADVTTALVKELRYRTHAGLMKCKKALVEAHGDIELAIDNLRKSGQATAAKKSGSVAAQGLIVIKIANNSKYGVIIELNCETDFVAQDKAFTNFGNEVVTATLDQKIIKLDVLKAKFEEQRIALVNQMGENINIRRIGFLEGDVLVSYLHYARIGVIVSATNAEPNLIKQIAMHIAAIKPEYVNANDIPSDIISREYQIQLNIAMQSHKSYEVTQKIIEGRMRQFTRDISLTDQNFIIDPIKTVGQLLEEHKAKINNFIRFEVGEGIKKANINFAKEVSALCK
ncbi:translation elongation factor Ts [Candidatus Palibaumannia cicadellinicola]|uniref:Elongation factor Ts n=1 Tax=Candidatus Palibaumannia cicadellinicola TaxID=186490 RepID=A0A088MZ12_9GAMM|nr:translation elongation factor Ts [Candidatus Baumannia cicadellinicola]AIN47449.1 Translation elongation factor Ts [Candidatus Baumannia cicadellinicola]